MKSERISRQEKPESTIFNKRIQEKPESYKYEPQRILSCLELQELSSKIIYANISEIYYQSIAMGIDFHSHLADTIKSRCKNG